MERDAVADVGNPPQPVAGILEGHAAHQAVYVVILFQKEFREIRPVLSRDARNERPAPAHNLVIRPFRNIVTVGGGWVPEYVAGIGRSVLSIGIGRAAWSIVVRRSRPLSSVPLFPTAGGRQIF